MKIILSTFVIGLFLFLSCTKGDNLNLTDDNTTKQSVADQISGIFYGTGKKMPQGIDLGLFKGCVTPTGWENNFVTGNSSVVVSKVNDNLVNLSFTASLNGVIYNNIKVVKNGNILNFGIGSYDINSKFLTISAMTGSYLSSYACLQGLPYFYGVQTIGTPSIYAYSTIGHIDFTGTKR